MGYFPVRYDSRVINYERRGFIRLATEDTDSNQAFVIFIKIFILQLTVLRKKPKMVLKIK